MAVLNELKLFRHEHEAMKSKLNEQDDIIHKQQATIEQLVNTVRQLEEKLENRHEDSVKVKLKLLEMLQECIHIITELHTLIS